MKGSVLVTDFDGTLTTKDFYSLIAERYMPAGAPDYFEQYRRGDISHVEAMQGFFQHAPSEPERLAELMRDTQPDARLAEAIRRLQQHGWEVIIVSAGSSWYIERILTTLNITAVVYSNPGEIVRGSGLELRPNPEAPFYSADVGVDKSAVVRDAIARSTRVAFAGDGPPDLKPALLVPPRYRFAKGYLAQELDLRGEEYVAFQAWPEIADSLLMGAEAG